MKSFWATFIDIWQFFLVRLTVTLIKITKSSWKEKSTISSKKVIFSSEKKNIFWREADADADDDADADADAKTYPSHVAKKSNYENFDLNQVQVVQTSRFRFHFHWAFIIVW